MSKLPTLKSREVLSALQQAGFVEHRQKGGHKIFKKGNLRVVVPVHPRDLKKGTVFGIIEQAGLTKIEERRVSLDSVEKKPGKGTYQNRRDEEWTIS